MFFSQIISLIAFSKKYILIAITKMDLVNYSQEIFLKISEFVKQKMAEWR